MRIAYFIATLESTFYGESARPTPGRPPNVVVEFKQPQTLVKIRIVTLTNV